jgi:SprB repeat
MRYLQLLLLVCLMAIGATAQAQCDIQTSLAITNNLCHGDASGSIDLSVSNGVEPYSYLWSNGQTTEDLGNLPAGIYTCTITDADLCTAVATEVVQQPTLLAVTTTPDPAILSCNTPGITISAGVSGGAPPYLYFWSNGQNTAVITPNVPGLYTITVTDQKGCSATKTTTVLLNNTPPVACIANPGVLTCTTTSLTLDATCSSTGSNFSYFWDYNTGNIITPRDLPTVVVDQPGFYIFFVTDLITGCISTASVTVGIENIPPAINAGPDLNLPCTDGVVTLAATTNIPNGTFAWSGPFIFSGGNTLNPIVNGSGEYTVTVTDPSNGCTSTDMMQVTGLNGNICGTISGTVLCDSLENCISDPGESPLANWLVQATGPLGSFFAVTNALGQYEIQVLSGGTYQVNAVLPSPNWSSCPDVPDVTVDNITPDVTADDLLIQKAVQCPSMQVEIASGNLRRCFNNNFFSVQYCNNGTIAAEDAYILITLDPLLSMVSSNIPYTDQGGGIIRFDVGDVAPGECNGFHFFTLLSCDAVLGQTHCTEAHIYPDSLCISNNPQWSGASLSITSQCDTDSVRFKIQNGGLGDMPQALDYIVIEDQVMLMMAPVQLQSGEETFVTVPANGSTWRLEMEQEPFHPGESNPAVSVEGCTIGTTFSTGFVMQYPTDDQDAFVDIVCIENTGSYDPNDKQGFPRGYGAAHYIKPGTPIEYMIRFQNTGNDTAFTVRLVDTLSQWLDPATFKAGVASHAYTWDIRQADILTFQFDNILLPDSTTNEPASHGFIKFTLQHRPDAPLETVIENTAAIYFDFNDPIITNTTVHRLGENFITVGVWQPALQGYSVQVTPNPMGSNAVISVKGAEGFREMTLQVFDLQGNTVWSQATSNHQFDVPRGQLSAGVYLFGVQENGRLVGNGKLIVR